jgi:8-oxo-dGTP pyrophosphatase MutT (NUDIX family)
VTPDDLASDPRKPWSARIVDTLLHNPYFSVLLQHVVVPDGTERVYYTVNFPSPAVGVIARRGDDVLLVRQYRFIVDEYVWAIPSGGVSEGESVTAAAARELEEETGYRAGRIEPLMFCYASYGCSNQRYEIFIADDLVDTGIAVDANEVIETRWFSKEELVELILKNGVVDNLSLSPLLLMLLREALRANRSS